MTKNLYLYKINGNITQEQFIDLNKDFANEKILLAKRKEDIGKLIKELKETSRNSEKWISIIKKYKDFDELTPTIVGKFIDYIEIGEKNKETGEQRIKIHWMF